MGDESPCQFSTPVLANNRVVRDYWIHGFTSGYAHLYQDFAPEFRVKISETTASVCPDFVREFRKSPYKVTVTRESKVTLPPNRWADERALDRVRRLNVRCLAAMAQVAQSESVLPGYNSVYANAELWARIDSRAWSRAGSCPVLLIDLNFQREDWWKRVTADAVVVSEETVPRLYPAGQAESLLREILMEAWSAGRSAPRATSFVFGMAPRVTDTIARLTVSDIDRVAAEHWGGLRPRWEHRGDFWEHLLRAVLSGDDQAMADVQLYCLQLLGGDVALHNP